uniref:Caspase-8-like n=1 Tax=Saccoglossus kowalevskii TaxID=10224 RepID=A0ABM0M9G8_SACKO|nr:PREDICTED: caspase-8-like [Saccoglossus kowalevskii]
MVLPHEDLNAADMLDVLWSTRLMDHRQFSCLIVCILSHGTLGKVCGCDGVTITLQELAKPFTPKYCKGLVGKPKMFFIQACQGEQSQQGIAQPSSTPQRDAIPFQYSSAPIQHSLQSSDESLPSIPNEADFLYGFCTVPGYEAYRDPDPSRGSWYISKLVESLEKYASTKHLLDILILVNKGVAEKGDENYKQMPAPQFTLRKKVLFN